MYYRHVQHYVVPQRGGGGGVEHDRLEEVGQVALVEEDQVGADHAGGAGGGGGGEAEDPAGAKHQIGKIHLL